MAMDSFQTIFEASALPHQTAQAHETLKKMDPNPPFMSTYKQLLKAQPSCNHDLASVEECELPLIDLSLLYTENASRCKREIAAASQNWGFFQVVNHGISSELLHRIRSEQVKLFRQPFENKCKDFSADAYRWGTPTATSLHQLSWSEAYHIPLCQSTDLSKHNTIISRLTIEELAVSLSSLAHLLGGVLAEELGGDGAYFERNCNRETCYLRLNRYPLCPVPGGLFGLVPHTDSDFLTILCQDEVGGLQLMKDGRWITVKPNPSALVVNIGDLFQAWSNGMYKSVEHRVISNESEERFSVAYFMCPSYDSMIESEAEKSIYRRFSFREYRQQVQEDVKMVGYKVGLSRFLVGGA
ncbi:gibberellin 2-beta-dioxygenase 8 isoform X1 [Dioscorea cayenensis subsp. rotundata]|uniref:Gibberellin 2-beta-dioxygenase 8 isoform X1 n=1 Tax=Dioscorea cayennensis subsp. rotundata TaxID=55577 RepID=A0AB40AXE8_DIOCR|nr:gibberellin 2-beta-dioxygenase 8 isoform X1 [Dioscorea cayenensis subsp. rotundata]